MQIKRRIKFLLHKRVKGEEKNLAIRMRVTLHGQQPFDIPTGYTINLSDWDIDKQRASETCELSSSINHTIELWLSTMNEIFARYELLEKRIPTIQELKDLFNDIIGRDSTSKSMAKNKLPYIEKDVFKVFSTFIISQSEKNQWTISTQKKFRSLEQHLKDYNSELSFDEINENTLSGFLSYLHKKGLLNTTVSKYLSFLKWFLRWANQKGYYSGDLHKTFKPKLKGTSIESKEIIYCTQDEIKKLQEYEFTDLQKSLEYVRDTFLFCCFTGLRYSDVERLKKTDVKNGVIHIVTQKTNDGLQIELNKHSQAILDKYKDMPTKDNLAIPVLSNVKANLYLKTIGQLCGIDEPTRIVYYQGNERHDKVFPKWALLTTHVARRTFVITALQLGIPAEIIMKWTGHNDFDAMKPYIKIVDELKQNAMSKFNDL